MKIPVMMVTISLGMVTMLVMVGDDQGKDDRHDRLRSRLGGFRES